MYMFLQRASVYIHVDMSGWQHSMIPNLNEDLAVKTNGIKLNLCSRLVSSVDTLAALQ